MELSYNSFHHYKYLDSQGNEVPNGDYFRTRSVAVDDEEAFMETHGPKKIVPVEDFVFKMLEELCTFKHLYNDTIVACLKAVSYRYHIKCAEPAEVVLNRCKEALCEIFPINPNTKATEV